MKKGNPRSGRIDKTDSRSSCPSRAAEFPKIPPLLLEDDESAPLSPSLEQVSLRRAELAGNQGAFKPCEPTEPSGPARLLLMARDPHSVYAHWELTAEQLRQVQAPAAAASLVLRLYHEQAGGPLAAQIPIADESSHAFIHVTKSGTQYIAEIGKLDRSGGWVSMTTSAPVVTPHDTVSDDKTAHFAEMPPALPRLGSAVGKGPVQRPAIENASKSEPADRGTLRAPLPRVSWLPSLTREDAEVSGIDTEVAMTPEALSPDQAELGAPAPDREAVGTIGFENPEAGGASSPLGGPLPTFSGLSFIPGGQ